MPHYPKTLRFVGSEEAYSIYTDPQGNEVCLQHGTGNRLVSLSDIDIEGAYADFWAPRSGYGRTSSDFLDHLRDLLVDPDEADEIRFCDDCSEPSDEDRMTWINDKDVCESCTSNYSICDDCEKYSSQTVWIAGQDRSVCGSCECNYSYCEDCDTLYHDDDSYEHDHEDCGCESPQQVFSIRNDGHDPLKNDVRATVSLPAGEISTEGVEAIQNLLRNSAPEFDYSGALDLDAREDLQVTRRNWYDLAERIGELGTTWQARDGNFTKRLSRFAYKEYKIKVPPVVISEVGNIGSAHSQGVEFGIETTRDLNMSAEEFGHEDSCFWGSYYASRCTLKSNGGFGLRSFSNDYDVSGRAWVIPLRLLDDGDLTPTFETESPDAFAVFNGYGAMSGYVPARIVAHMAGMTYRKVSFEAGVIYVNSNSGYLVAPEEIAKNYTDGQLTLNIDDHSDLYRRESARDSAAA